MPKPRMLEHRRIDLGRIDARDEQPAIQQRLARAARRTADFDALIVGRQRQAAPLDRLFQLGIRPRHGMRRQPNRNRPARPPLGSAPRGDSRSTTRPARRRRHPARGYCAAPACERCASFAFDMSHASGAAARSAASISSHSGVTNVCARHRRPSPARAAKREDRAASWRRSASHAGMLPNLPHQLSQLRPGQPPQRNAVRVRKCPIPLGQLPVVERPLASVLERQKTGPRKRQSPRRLACAQLPA